MNDLETTSQRLKDLLEQLSTTHSPLERLEIIGELTELQQTFTLQLKSARASEIRRVQKEKDWNSIQVAEALGLTKSRITQILKTPAQTI